MFGLHEWFIRLSDGNIPLPTSTDVFGIISDILFRSQWTIVLALHTIWPICLISKPPI